MSFYKSLIIFQTKFHVEILKMTMHFWFGKLCVLAFAFFFNFCMAKTLNFYLLKNVQPPTENNRKRNAVGQLFGTYFSFFIMRSAKQLFFKSKN
jgi:hypothetical protein